MTDFEQEIDQAWRAFRVVLGDAVAGLGKDEAVEFDVETGGSQAFVEIFREHGWLGIQMAGNGWLDKGQRLRKPARRRMKELGFGKPDSDQGHYWMHLDRHHADRAAYVVVAALREVYGVQHPAFLVGDIPGWCPPGPVESELRGEPLADLPRGHEDLDAMIESALLPVLGQPPVRDDDGDIGIHLGTAMMYVRARHDEPRVEFFARVVHGVAHAETALEAVNDLNLRFDGLRFVFTGEAIFAHQELDAMPFAPEVFRTTLGRFIQVVADVDQDLAARVGGKVCLAEEDTESRMHPVMQQLLQLDAERPGSLRPKDVAKICGYDCELITELITWNERQETSWRQARDEAGPGEREVCEHELAHARHTTKLLRKTLRRVLLG